MTKTDSGHQAVNTRARQTRRTGWLLMGIAFAMIGVSLPVDGLLGSGLAFGGIALIWWGWFLVVCRGGTR